MIELSAVQRRELRAKAHHLHPVVSIAGSGLSESVLKEIDAALKAHELIKIRVYGDDRELRSAYMETICSQLGCAPVQSIGKLLLVYRPAPEEDKKRAAKPAAKRPGRPTTANPPRMALRGEETRKRARKPTAGSNRPRKSER